MGDRTRGGHRSERSTGASSLILNRFIYEPAVHTNDLYFKKVVSHTPGTKSTRDYCSCSGCDAAVTQLYSLTGTVYSRFVRSGELNQEYTSIYNILSFVRSFALRIACLTMCLTPQPGDRIEIEEASVERLKAMGFCAP
eukprot:SAG11_NODE_13013_length_674_cov_0.784348_1_plen_138_part_01